MWRGAYGRFSALIDDLMLSVQFVSGDRRGFSRSTPVESIEYDVYMEPFRQQPPRFHWPKDRPRRRVRLKVELPAMDYVTCADFTPARGEADTLVVYHHGLGEIPHHRLPRLLFLNRELRQRCDLLALRAIHHESWPRVRDRLLVDIHEFCQALAASAAMAKTAARERGAGYRHLVMCGVSMGGVVSLVESLEPSFDLYVPIIAGPDLLDVMLRSGFSRVIQRRFRQVEGPKRWLQDFDLTSWLQSAESRPLRPILARDDRLFRYAIQKDAYASLPGARITTMEGAHFTGALNIPVVSGHLRRAIDEHCWAEEERASLG